MALIVFFLNFNNSYQPINEYSSISEAKVINTSLILF